MQLAINHVMYQDRDLESTTVKGSCWQFGLDSCRSRGGLLVLIIISNTGMPIAVRVSF